MLELGYGANRGHIFGSARSMRRKAMVAIITQGPQRVRLIAAPPAQHVSHAQSQRRPSQARGRRPLGVGIYRPLEPVPRTVSNEPDDVGGRQGTRGERSGWRAQPSAHRSQSAQCARGQQYAHERA